MSFLDVLSLYAIIAIWGLMLINIFLSIGGFIYTIKVNKTNGRVAIDEYPMVSVMVPAHNESKNGFIIIRV